MMAMYFGVYNIRTSRIYDNSSTKDRIQSERRRVMESPRTQGDRPG